MLLELIKRHVDKTYLHVQYPFESKYQLLIIKKEKIRINKEKIQRYSQTVNYLSEGLEHYNPTKK